MLDSTVLEGRPGWCICQVMGVINAVCRGSVPPAALGQNPPHAPDWDSSHRCKIVRHSEARVFKCQKRVSDAGVATAARLCVWAMQMASNQDEPEEWTLCTTIHESGCFASPLQLASRAGKWVRKYFWEGQKLSPQGEEARKVRPVQQAWATRNRALLALGVPIVFFHAIWWVCMLGLSLFRLFDERCQGPPRYVMCLAMLVGSFIAGATSEGGGAISYPTMTLLMGVSPTIARDFGLMIQCVAMTSASFSIIVLQIKVDTGALVFCSIGSAVGIVVGLERVAPTLEPAFSTMYAVVTWLAFAFVLGFLNRNRDRVVFDGIPNVFGKLMKVPWKPLVLGVSGFVGGIFSAMSGSGTDLCAFSVLTLMFRVSEKVAVPTSVILMAVSTCIGFVYRQFAMGDIDHVAWEYLAICVPIVVVGGPLGAVIGSHFHRLALSGLIVTLDVVQFILTLVAVKPWLSIHGGGQTDSPAHLSIASTATLVFSAMAFKLMEMVGSRVLLAQEEFIRRHRPREPSGSSTPMDEIGNVQITNGEINFAIPLDRLSFELPRKLSASQRR